MATSSAPGAPVLVAQDSFSAGNWTAPSHQRVGSHSLAATVTAYALATLLLYVAYEQFSFWSMRRKGGGKVVPGPRFPVPLLGGLVPMVMDPYKFWEDQRKFSFPGFSYNSILGKFMIFITDVDISRHVFSYNGHDSLLMAVHPSGKNILGPQNLAFMHGPAHKAIRKSFLALFTRKALGTYVQLQDGIIRRHLADWMNEFSGREVDIRSYIRDMNAATSQEVFAGPYLGDEKTRAKVSQSFADMTTAFLAFPLCLPGTAVWAGRQGRLFILKVLEKGAGQAKAAMKAGGEPRCLMDFWAVRCLEEMREAEEKGVPPPGHTTDHAMADTVMDFLFASQDASTASLVWMVCLMAGHPDVLAKVREEQLRVRGSPDAPVTGEVLSQMTYTRQVVKEVLRLRPPAPMVPQWAMRDFELPGGYTCPKGSLIMPSLIASTMQGYPDADKFDPDRFANDDMTFQKYFLTFGHGPHYCVGKEYAINHLTAFIAILATSCDWTRRLTERSRDDGINWQYLPTIYPADSHITMQYSKPAKAAA
ncbi:hypothetical protein WJX73_002257 [Symbiochloris irregularis]|uniref:C-22 sterol desaturase n=1 Tax=Symbiochloris irregularis TaxID=706552 RepID=A0AAW1PZ65_9CHLO